MIPREPILTGRLVLRPVGPEMAEDLWNASRGSLTELRPWLAWAATASPETTRAFAGGAAANWEAGTDHVFALLEEGSVVGSVGCHIPRSTRSFGEIGYWVRTDRTGRGYATEATGAVVRWAFRTLGLSRLELRAGVENVPSQRVAERLGFRKEGNLRRGCPHPDGGYDCFLYGLLPEDLAAVPS